MLTWSDFRKFLELPEKKLVFDVIQQPSFKKLHLFDVFFKKCLSIDTPNSWLINCKFGWFQYTELSLLHGPMAGFTIFYEAGNGSRQHIDVGNVNTTTLTNLKKYTEYRLSVAVRNTIYTGPASGVITRRTLEDGGTKILRPFFLILSSIFPWSSQCISLSVPDAGPQNTSSKKVNDTTFLITWQPLTSDQSNGIVTKYEIFWSFDLAERRSRRSLPEVGNATTKATQYTLYNLRLCANYTVSVRGYTSVGPGPRSIMNIVTSSKGKFFILENEKFWGQVGNTNIYFYCRARKTYKRKDCESN